MSSSQNDNRPEKILTPRAGEHVAEVLLRQQNENNEALTQEQQYQRLAQQVFNPKSSQNALNQLNSLNNLYIASSLNNINTQQNSMSHGPYNYENKIGQAYETADLRTGLPQPGDKFPETVHAKHVPVIVGFVFLLILLVLLMPWWISIYFGPLFIVCISHLTKSYWADWKRSKDKKTPVTGTEEKNGAFKNQKNKIETSIDTGFWLAAYQEVIKKQVVSKENETLLKAISDTVSIILLKPKQLPANNSPDYFYLTSTIEKDLPEILTSILAHAHLLDEEHKNLQSEELLITLENVFNKLVEIKNNQAHNHTNRLKASLNHMRHKAKQ